MIGVGTFKTTSRMRELVNQVLDAGRLSYGPFSREFEKRFAALHDSRFAVLSNSGTSSLHVAIQTLKELHKWQDGDEIIVPAVTFVATVNAVLHNRLTPVLVDVDPLYYEIDLNRIARAVTQRTRAIIPVHLFGQPCDLLGLADLALAKHLKIIEDSCECMFVSHTGSPVGSWGDIGVFSTYIAHLLTTGVGGVAVTSDPDYAAVMRSLVNHGRDGIYLNIDDDDQAHGAALTEIISRRFNFERIGHSFRITELEAALGLAQLDDWRAMIQARQSNAEYLTRHLSRFTEHLQLPSVRPETEHAYMMYPIVLLNRRKAALCDHLEACGVETREMLPLVNQPCYRGLWNPDAYPIAQWIERGGFYVGCHQDLMRDDLDSIVKSIASYFERRHEALDEMRQVA